MPQQYVFEKLTLKSIFPSLKKLNNIIQMAPSNIVALETFSDLETVLNNYLSN